MPAYLTYENYITRPEESLSPPKLANLMKIINALAKKSPLPMTIQELRLVTGLQSGQINSAMNQRGMKVLFTGEGVAFELSKVGKEVIAGEREVTLRGITNKANKNKMLLSPLTNEEFHELPQKIKDELHDVINPAIEAFIKNEIKPPQKLTDDTNIKVIRAVLWKFTDYFTKLTQSSEPVANKLQQINGAKPTIKAATPNG